MTKEEERAVLVKTECEARKAWHEADNAYREARVPVLREGFMMELEMFFCNQVAALQIAKGGKKKKMDESGPFTSYLKSYVNTLKANKI